MLLLEEGKDYDNVDDAHLPYRHIRNLGHGHSGVVEEVIDEVTKAVYARKTIWLPASRASKEEQTKVFHNEIKIIRSLGNHRHIIQIFTTYKTKRHVGIILQPVASQGDLEEFLAEYWSDVRQMEETNEPNPRLEAMVTIIERAFGCLAVGLAFIHEKKVRHKDVKPKNILIDKGRVIYTDFGYSFDSSAFSRSTTDGRPNALTRKYSAPEVIDYDERNSKSDVYSLGCVFIDLLSALTLAMDPDEVRCYSESMIDLHARMLSWEISPRHESLPHAINSMTTRDPSSRSCAIHLATEVLQLHGFCCPECATISLETQGKDGNVESSVERVVTMGEMQFQPEKERDLVTNSATEHSAYEELESEAQDYVFDEPIDRAFTSPLPYNTWNRSEQRRHSL
ncbi:Nn.00g107460.m01.CDS01 [Neocucurbitaria sp. VM-36]